MITTKEILNAYNALATELGEKTVNRFSDRKTAFRRLDAIKARHAEANPPAAPKKSNRYKGFNFPVSEEGIKNMREGTLRATVRDTIADGGATLEDVQDAVKKYDITKGKQPYDVEIRTYEAIRLLHFYVGYGLEERDGKIFLVNA